MRLLRDFLPLLVPLAATTTMSLGSAEWRPGRGEGERHRGRIATWDGDPRLSLEGRRAASSQVEERGERDESPGIP